MVDVSKQQTVLITGGDGYVGSNLTSFFTARDFLVYRSVISARGFANEVVLDITNSKSVSTILNKIKPDIIIHTAGLSNLVECEKDPDKADLINFVGTKNIIDLMNKETRFVFFSSDYVFDGRRGDYKETDAAHPKTIYGKTKLKAEEYISLKLKNYIIIRTANIFGRGGNFFQFVLDSLMNNRLIEVYDDVTFTPTQIDFLINAIYRLIFIDFRGTIHVTGQDKITRYGFATKIASEIQAKKGLIGRSYQGRDGLIAKDSSLNTELLSGMMDLYSPSIPEAIHMVLNHQNAPYFKFKDNRGKILGICQSQNWQEVNYFESKKDSIRGNHYHKNTIEVFYIIEGRIEVTLKDLKSGEITVFFVSKGGIFSINPNTLHTFRIETNTKWINMLSSQMIGKNKDIHKV